MLQSLLWPNLILVSHCRLRGHWRPYLFEKHFTVTTDHHALTRLYYMQDTSNMLTLVAPTALRKLVVHSCHHLPASGGHLAFKATFDKAEIVIGGVLQYVERRSQAGAVLVCPVCLI